MKDQIWLTGFMGTGKSRVSRPLAAALDWQALDVDELVIQRTGDTIDQIFEKGGEAAFRVVESEIIEELASRSEVVVATGGGAVIADSNRAAMRRRGLIVCLEARPETIAARVKSDATAFPRPLLQGSDPLAKITQIKSERQPMYAQADFIIQTDDLTPDQVTHQVLTAFREQSAVSAGGHPI